jgi:hypothetical protein
MITNAIIDIVQVIVNFFDSLMPNITWPSFMSSGTIVPSGWVNAVGNVLHPLVPFLPIDVLLTIVYCMMLFWPAIGAYLVFDWIWKKTPTIAGTGTGNG